MNSMNGFDIDLRAEYWRRKRERLILKWIFAASLASLVLLMVVCAIGRF